MKVFLTEIQLVNFLRTIFEIEPTVDSVSWGTDKIINIKELGIHITFDMSGGYINNLRISDSGERFGYFLYLDCIDGILHIENKHGVLTEKTEADREEILKDFHGFFMNCESPKIKARLRDLKIEDILKNGEG